MPDLKVGLIGPGAIGQTHARAIAEIESLRLAAVAGGAPEDAAALAGGEAAQWFATAEAMIDGADLDIVVIATPSGAHYAPAAQAIATGRHVLVEKPLCVDWEEAARLVVQGEQAGLTCGVVSQRRLEPQHVYIHDALRAGRLGAPRLIEADVHWWRSPEYYREKSWRAEIGHGGGSLFNQGVHSLDLMLWLFGPVVRVQGLATTLGHDLPIEDTTAAILTFASGAIGTLVTTTATPPGHPAGLRMFTDRGAFTVEHASVVRWDFTDVPAPGASSGIASGAANPGDIGIAGHVQQWQDFIAAIHERRAPAVSFRDGFEAVRVASAIYRSSEEGRAVSTDEFPVGAEG
ncbi:MULTISPECIES: Gfo/Idh/MocA family oxidoreductase [unclassified Chelatococcus]|uniref:Gfo/Idh/MocA family protein n=1 Tax=unclassified Chelatococcus TaxID=2638111 RepID=UPI001BCE991F|nr:MULTISPECIES: Gfo/Idh/MocA family oxidoreductase [unclassified Chelatococcus]CAH1650840.1 putative dehydrogenase [Hyphomicrobiales bacterium]MBS7739780.1 Gfo/Idh/MocA family oxidoreductase [Chelatococcus sp. HY11]MBX3545423.1 Gfo/Idh/MocA family oxidoreductase [Chelatococcus sp.]MCO5078921.1 Gfo/Idh/MocA family oxidoreductase [Chelatococcus sp.]CAH1686446.1 putative dehydrogenase [Hyphomicrobiales bacterium]